jgi:hypothetical protein
VRAADNGKRVLRIMPSTLAGNIKQRRENAARIYPNATSWDD